MSLSSQFALELFNQDYTIPQIIEKTLIDKKVVYKILKARILAKTFQLRKKGEEYLAISAAFGIPDSTLRAWIRTSQKQDYPVQKLITLFHAGKNLVEIDQLTAIGKEKLYTKLRPFLLEEIKKHLDNDVSFTQISKILGMSRDTVQRWVKAEFKADTPRKQARLFNKGSSLTELKKKTGMSQKKLYRELKVHVDSRVLELRQLGKTDAEIIEFLGISKHILEYTMITIPKDHCQKTPIDLFNMGYPLDIIANTLNLNKKKLVIEVEPILVEQLKVLLQEGRTINEIATYFRFNRQSIRRWIKRFNLEIYRVKKAPIRQYVDPDLFILGYLQGKAMSVLGQEPPSQEGGMSSDMPA